MSYTKHSEFIVGARNRLMGLSQTQSMKHLDRYDYDTKQENKDGWIFMDNYLAIVEILRESRQTDC